MSFSTISLLLVEVVLLGISQIKIINSEHSNSGFLFPAFLLVVIVLNL